MPPELPDMWDRDGRLVRVDYSDLTQPIIADDIPLDRRIAERRPCRRRVKTEQFSPVEN
jgi:hypothetical protein